MKWLIVLVVLSVSSVAYAERSTIEPRYYDLTPNDGFMDAGTAVNPYEIKDSYGNTRATIEPRYYDMTPDDGFMDAGTTVNPYVIDWENKY